MPLTPGARLGPYEVTAEIGRGGMGEVYQARDTKLDRDVALKVLPDAFSSDPDRLARFEREAKVLASLNHPNIGHIYGFEEDEAEGTRALVLELVEGPTLADRIADGPIPVDEALPIAKQIAEALEAAHEQGIIHRDLKPANVKVKADGTVKVLDFGLAKAFQPEASGASASESPTISLTAAATQMGMVIGTAAYMSPEQAKGKTVSKRADVWAFGAVLYEMLAGTKAFSGEDVTDTIAAVVRAEPDWSALPLDVPARVGQVVRACLQKSLTDRARDIGDIDLALRGTFETTATSPTEVGAAPTLQVWQRPVPALIGALLLAVIASVAGWGLTRPDVVPANVTRFVMPSPDAAPFAFHPAYHDLTISADGTLVVYQARAPGGELQLYLRPIDQLVGTPLRGTEGGADPFVSPDGEWVGFVDGTLRTLRKVSIFGGPPVTLAEFQNVTAGASWGDDDQVIVGTARGGLFRVPEGGGEPDVLTTPDADNGEAGHLWPSVIPGRQAVLFDIGVGFGDPPQIAVLALNTGDVTQLGLVGVNPQYVSTGHLVYAVEDGSLRAVPFDVDALHVTGTPVPLVEGVMVKNPPGAANFSVSDQGALVYTTAASASNDRTLALVDRRGVAELLNAPPNQYLNPRISPDGRRFLVQTQADEHSDLWIYDLSGETQIRQLTQGGINRSPIWTPDGDGVTYASDEDGAISIYSRPADGSGVPTQVIAPEGETTQSPMSWSPDGRVLAFARVPALDSAIWTASLNGETEPELFYDLPDGSDELGAVFSPNGRWLAFHSDGVNEAGGQIHILPFPATGVEPQQITQNGGVYPLWSRDGNELFYRRPIFGRANEARLVGVEVITDTPFAVGPEQELPIADFFTAGRDYDITPDGERFVVVLPSEESSQPQINVVLNWFEELKARVP